MISENFFPSISPLITEKENNVLVKTPEITVLLNTDTQPLNIQTD